MKFDIKQLHVFIAVAENTSFSRAAKILGIAQASVSERVSILEDDIGVRLFDRVSRGVELTRTGEFLLDRARQLVVHREEIVRELQDFLGVQQGAVVMGASTAPGGYIMPRLLARFHADFPAVSTRMVIGHSEGIISKIDTGQLELGVVGQRKSQNNLEFKKIWRDEVVLVVAPGHKWAGRKKPVSGSELAKAPLVVRETGSGTRAVADAIVKKHLPGGQTAPSIAAELGSLTAVKEGVKAGLGVTLISLLTVRDELENGSLVKVPIKRPVTERFFYLVRDRRRTLSPAASELWRFVHRETKTKRTPGTK